MKKLLLEMKDVSADVEGKEILHHVDLQINKGEVHVLMGPNGAGKSTTGHVLMGNPRYHVKSGNIIFKGQDITEESVDKRAKAGMFLSFQEPLEVPGLSIEGYLKTAYEQIKGKHIKLWDFRKKMQEAMEILQMDKSYGMRDLNVGFSGGEKKKAEILQLMLLEPDFAILDETDSGLDVDAVRVVSKGIESYQEKTGGALLIITHSTRILEHIHVDYTHICVDGRMVTTGDESLVKKINEGGYEAYLQQSVKNKYSNQAVEKLL